jgi:hypothetical protein
MSFEFITRIGLLILFGIIMAIVFNAGTVAACLMTGVKFTKIAVFFGKQVFAIQTRFGPVSVGYIPTGGFVQLDMDAFPAQPLSRRCIVILSGPLALFLSSLLCLGLQHASFSFTMAFPQLVEILVSPVSRGREFFTLFFEKAQPHPILGYGVLAAKAVALDFLPLATLPGGRLLIEMAKLRDASKFVKALNFVSGLIGFGIFVRFAAVVIRYFWKTH